MQKMRSGIAVFLTALLIAGLLPAAAFAAPSYTAYELYVERPASEAGNKFYHGAKYEPKTGAYLAMFAEGDEKMHDAGNSTHWTGPDEWYFGGTPRITGKEHAAYMVYVHYDSPTAISHYASHYRAAKERGKAMQICMETMNGLDEVKNDAHLQALVQQAKEADIPIFLRFDSEFNDESNPWHKDGPAKYIEKFRIVADAFHRGAPNVAMVWAPNDWPIGSEDAYYPGDQYVDWVGVSSYPIYNANGTPKQGNNWIDRFYLLYEKYGKKKPVFITEGAPSPSVEYHPDQDVTNSAQAEIRQFYAGAARRMPNLKMIFYWSNNEEWSRMIQCQLSTNARMLAAYKSAIADPYYLGSFNTSSSIYYQKAGEATMKAGREKVSCYVNDVNNRVEKAVYYINGKYAGEGRFPDYTATLDFTPYASQTVQLRADFYNQNDVYLKPVTVNVKVTGEPVRIGNYSFYDVKKNAWYFNDLKYVIERGMMNGTSDTTFSPEGTITRAMIVTILHRMEGQPEAAASAFTDVVKGSWYEKAVNWASEQGVVNGMSAKSFAPNNAITREQFAAILYRYADTNGLLEAGNAPGYYKDSGVLDKYSDAGKVSEYAAEAMAWANEEGLINGVTDTTLVPQGKATRAQAAAILRRFCDNFL